MSSPALSTLNHTLGRPLPAALDKLDAQELGLLNQAVSTLKTEQSQHMRQAMEEALKHVPALLRGTVRKILLG